MQLRRGCKGWPLMLLAVAMDRVSKAVALRLPAGEHRLLPGIVNVNRTANTGMAFSMLSGHAMALAGLTLLVIIGVVAWLIAHPDEPRTLRAGLWLIVGGGLGNLYDRLALGYVIDFIDLAFIRFAVFNVADVCICVGAGLALIGAALAERRGRGEAHADIRRGGSE